MKVIDIKNVIRKDIHIYYRRLYNGLAVVDLLNKAVEFTLDFQIEHKPTGLSEISILSMGTVDYPVVPLQKELKQFIGVLDSQGKLPI